MKFEIELDEHEATALKDFIISNKKINGVVLDVDSALHIVFDTGLEELGYG